MTSVLDEKRRVVLPKDIVEDLRLVEGSAVTFKKEKGAVVMKRAEKGKDVLREMMSWNPKRTGRLSPIKEGEIKEMWG